MAEYISREVAVEKITYLCELREIVCNPDDEFLRGLKTALNFIKSNKTMPSAEDVQPVVHAYWIELPKALNPNENPCKCSNCGHKLSFMNDYPKSKYCPDCGARMDLKDGDAK